MPEPAAVDLSETLRPYQGQWVALAEDESVILGSGSTIDEALAGARRKGVSQPIIIRVPESVTAYLL